MPPATTFEKEMILEEAFNIIRKDGLVKLTARNIAHNLGCSTQPVYSEFGSMKKLQNAVLKKAYQFAIDYFLQEKQSKEIFYTMGLRYFQFSREEKALFKLLFLEGEYAFTIEKMRQISPPLVERMKQDRNLHSLAEDRIRRIGRDMWIYTHGLVSMAFFSELPDIEEFVKTGLLEMGKTVIEWENQQLKG
ncbi:MAG TPA: hypothetical protein PLP19_22240 [bacterium]|nr:hypothetical protein [bacterium]HPN46221.1 hypothetical protein [bacterium]